MKAETPIGTCTPMFTAELFTIVEGGNNPNVHQQMNKQNVAYMLNGISFTLNSNEIMIHAKHEWTLKIFCKRKKWDPKGLILYDTTYMRYLELENS